MAVKVYSIETLRNERRQVTYETQVPFILNGKEHAVTKKIVNGEMETFELTRPIGEMLQSGSLSNFKDLMKKVVLDVELGREQVPLLYQPIYERISDPNLPKLIDAKWALHGAVVFLEHFEGQEVKFGSVQAEQGPVARINTYSAGFEYTKEMKDFNDSFSVEILNRAMGEAYNALLNHIHLYPIISFNYGPNNKTAFQGQTSDPVWVRIYQTLTKAIADAAGQKRPGTILLASTMDKANVEMALSGGYQYNGTVYPAVSGIESVIYYDGWSVQVGKKTYEYPGVPQGKAYLIRPRRGFKELIKKDLQIEAAGGDLSRLIEEQIVGYAYRGAYAAIEENVQEISLA
jgi:hypothetical protein